MSLQIVVIGATNVPNPETFGQCDPYVSVLFQGQKKKTEVIKSELNPTWNQTLDFDLQGVPASSGDEVIFEVKDWERVGRNRLLGTLKIKLRELTKGGQQSRSCSENLVDANGRPHQAKINFKITYTPPADNQSNSDSQGSQGQVVEQPDDSEEEEEEAGGDQPDAGGGGGGGKKKKRKMGKRKKSRASLSNKPQDFQIRIKILEARQLQGANIQPVTRVTCFNQMKQTRVKKSTNSPYWNESFFFNFHSSPAELFDELIEFQVFNSRKLRSDALIGSFKCDVGLVYDENQHALINKWLLLSDPEDTMSGAKGYLKICAVVLGPGDEAPSMKSSTQDDNEDIESNLLRPAGVQLRPASFILKLYRAEDIPRMDSAFMEGVKKVFRIGEEQKELVDPYFVFSFAGKELKSKIMYCCDHPEWNQELRLGLQFPSMCERIKFMIKDWDRLSEDDTVGTFLLPISLISSSGDAESTPQIKGFLPTFGPCYVNFYGSTREYSDLPDEYEDLNLGKGEGVSYRGRALVELKTELGELPETPVEDIHSDDLLRVQKFMRRRKYRLHAAFLNATMVNAIDAPVEFEVSIGNYGNKLDENVAPCASTTQPTNAVFDGCCYYFLPWGGTKPCVVVDSSWEDISFRLEALNLILKIIDSLESNMERVKIGIKAKLPIPEVAQLLISLLDQLVLDCRKTLPEPVKGQHQTNELDKLTLEYRRGELDMIGNQATKLRENATDINEAMSEIENYLAMLKNLAVEPQNSMPDVSIWMISGEKRIAYFRIPANEVLFSKNGDTIGRQCGKLQTIQLKFPGLKLEKEKKWEVPSLLQVRIWLGLQSQESEWHNMQKEGELAVFAETYENMVSILGSWTTKGPTMSRPKFSDSQGKLSLPKEFFVPPPGWRWDGDWYISPELSMMFEKDAGHKTFIEDIYECQSRGIPGGTWQQASRPWSDVKGDQCPGRDEIVLQPGWKWDNEWQVDLNRAVDEEGETEKPCIVKLNNDTRYEREEEFRLMLGNPLSEGHKAKVGNQNTTKILVKDIGDKPFIRLEKTKYIVKEPMFKEETSILVVKVIRQGDQSETSTVSVSTKDGSAKSGEDYNGFYKEVVFKKNETVKDVEIEILYDGIKEAREVFTVHLKHKRGIADVRDTKARVYIEERNKVADVTFPSKPMVVSLRDYDTAEVARKTPYQGYPVVCLTPCNPKHPDFSKTAGICASEGINDTLTLFRWRVSAPTGVDGVTSNMQDVESNTFFANTKSISLDSIYFSGGSRIQCGARAVNTEGDPGLETLSHPVIVSQSEGLCEPRVMGSVGAEPFTAKFKYTGPEDPNHPNKVRVAVTIPHRDGMLPVVSTNQLSNFELTLSKDGTRLALHRCSNLLDYNEIPTEFGFITNTTKNPNIIGEVEPYQYSTELRGKPTLRFYKNLNLDACVWEFVSYYDMSELVNECGGSIDTDGQVLNMKQSYVSLRVPLYVSYVFHSPVATGGWQHYDMSSQLQLTFVYDTAILWQNGISSPEGSGGLQGYLYPTSMRIGDDDRLTVSFRTEARFRGQFVPSHPGTNMESMVMSPDRPELTFTLNLVRTEPTYEQPEQLWEFVSDFAVRDYSGMYTIKLVPCTTPMDQEYSLPITCNPRTPLSFDLPIRFQQVSDPVPERFSLNTDFHLMRKRELWLSDGSMGFADDADPAFTVGDRLYGRVNVDPVQNLGDSFGLSIEKVFLCSGKDGYIPKYNPDNQEYGCLADSPNLQYTFKIVDKNAPYSVVETFRDIPFNAKLAVEDPDALQLVRQPGADGFQIDCSPMFKVDAGRQWFLHAIYTVRSKANTDRGIRRKRDTEYHAVLAPRIKRAQEDAVGIGESGRGTNLARINMNYDTEQNIFEVGKNTTTTKIPLLPIVIAIAVLLLITLIIIIIFIRRRRKSTSPPPSPTNTITVATGRGATRIVSASHSSNSTSEV